MDWDEAQAKQQTRITIGDDLARLSVADLRARIAACKAELVRLEVEIAARLAHEAAASRLFKS